MKHKMTFLQQKNLFFVQFLTQFNTLLADFNWDSSVRIFFLKAKINYKLFQVLIFIIATSEYNDYDEWVQLLVKLAENVKMHAQKKCLNLSHNNHFQQNHAQYNTSHMNSVNSMQLNAAWLLFIERMCRLQNNLCFYCKKSEHFKNECMKVIKIIVFKKRNCKSSMYWETLSYRETYQETSHEELQYNCVVNWKQASVTSEFSMLWSITLILTFSESTIRNLKDQFSV